MAGRSSLSSRWPQLWPRRRIGPGPAGAIRGRAPDLPGGLKQLSSRIRTARRCRTAEQWRQEEEAKGQMPLSAQITGSQNDGRQGATPANQKIEIGGMSQASRLSVPGDPVLDHRRDLRPPFAAVEDAVMAGALGEVIFLL